MLKVMTAQSIAILLDTAEPPELGPGPRPGVQTRSELESKLREILDSSDLPEQNQQLIRALILLYHDHLEPAHALAQEIETPDGAFVHGIMHRREPDYGNAKYWFRRVGNHPAFPAIAGEVLKSFDRQKDRTMLNRLVPKDVWDAFAFVDLCQEAAAQPAEEASLRKIQAIETKVLLARFAQE